ncbi:unnamed protein product [Rotaria magnacalcarata]|uniref:F-box domain-containing protein n=1 Tax=Rotaria magnacalcarata TaxID=392030 RepID=A0A819RGK8_9BILA|nr:unnamed protein product [Rotaria magnacalcarata]CAF4052033.1 unnamed protein product [Rotaria magnacalcarata]
MNQHNVHLLDLPNEILFLILRKLNNVDVLYSLMDINNQRLDSIAQDQIFTNILNLAPILQSTDGISSSILDRFCVDILPRIHKNVKSLTAESDSMECILGAGNYPNLTELKLLNFNQAIVPRYFMDDFLFGHNHKQQITDIILISDENTIEITREEYTQNVYAIILAFFENLKHLSIVMSSNGNYPRWIHTHPCLSLYESLPTTFFSSTLTKLCVNVTGLDDIHVLLDGRLEQLTIFTVQIEFISYRISTSYNTDNLPNLKCFSLTCYSVIGDYDITILPLLRRMSHLEELALFLNISGGSTFISGTHLDNEILIHMRQLHTFTFYIEAVHGIADPGVRISADDIKRTFTNIKYSQVACMVDYVDPQSMMYRVFSLPTKFNRLEQVTNNIPNIVFNSVTHLKLRDENAFKHEFFVRVARAFPFLKNLSISNIRPPFWRFNEHYLRDKDWCSIIEYSHLICLDVRGANFYYLEHFLNETKTHLPCLAKLNVDYDDLQVVTENFTRDEMRRNCGRVKRLIVQHPIVYPENVYRYFPLL